MSTMCSCCAPSHLLDWNGDLVDHGFNMPDTRENYEIYGPCGACNGTGEISVEMAKGMKWTTPSGRSPVTQEYLEEHFPCECDECWGSREAIIGSVSVSIERKWDSCECGSGESVMTGHSWGVAGPGARVSVPSSVNTFALVKAIWPSAREPEYDADWESERGLRRAEGWGC
jgi:hypothetical protein